MMAMAIAMGLHVRCGIEDTLNGPHRERMTSVQQIEHMVQQARLLNRDIANGDEAREIYQIGQFYQDTDETLGRLGYTPNRRPGERGTPVRHTQTA